MKNNIFIVVSLSYLSMMLVSCSKDNEELETKVTISPTSVSMYYDDVKQLSSSNVTNWSSKNVFVADVDDKGLVKAAHVGTTQIIASNGQSSAVCEVIVKPKYDLYDTPILEWGISKSILQSKETHKPSKTTISGDALAYDYSKGGKSYALMYSFENDKLAKIVVFTDLLSYVDVGSYLLERYQPASIESDLTMFFDGYTKDQITTAIGLQTYKISGTTLTMVSYIPAEFSSTRSSGFYADLEIIKDCGHIK